MMQIYQNFQQLLDQLVAQGLLKVEVLLEFQVVQLIQGLLLHLEE